MNFQSVGQISDGVAVAASGKANAADGNSFPLSASPASREVLPELLQNQGEKAPCIWQKRAYPTGRISGKAPPKAGQWSHAAKQKEGCDKKAAIKRRL